MNAGGRSEATLRGDLLWLAGGLAVVLGWDLSGLDLRVTAAFGTPQGFAWRYHWIFQTLLHDLARKAAWALLAVLVWRAFAPTGWWGTAPRTDGAPGGPRLNASQRRWALLGIALNLVVVPMLKQFSLTSCPHALAMFGGPAQWVSHWMWGMADGGPGRCFPSGHVVAAFAFLPMALAWREQDKAVAGRWLVSVLAGGALLGLTQVVRGEHYLSHVLWSGLLCAGVAVAVHHLSLAVTRARTRATPSA